MPPESLNNHCEQLTYGETEDLMYNLKSTVKDTVLYIGVLLRE